MSEAFEISAFLTGIEKTDDNSKFVMANSWIINSYSPKWRWIVVDICQATKQRGKYLPLLPTLKWIIVLVYTTHAE